MEDMDDLATSQTEAIANVVDVAVAVQIIVIVLVSSVLVEILSWYVVYRTNEYKRLVTEITSTCRKIGEFKRGSVGDKDAPKKKKKLDDALLKISREFSMLVRFKTGLITMVAMLIVYRFVSTTFAGITVARLPFTPPSFIQRLTHNGLPGTDMLDCSALCIYVLCGMAVRSNVTKFLNLGPSREVTAATMPQAVSDKGKWE